MSQWIITPDKYPTPDEKKQLRKICNDHTLIAKAKGIQACVRYALNLNNSSENLTGV